MGAYPVYVDEPINGNLGPLQFGRLFIESFADNLVAGGTVQLSATPLVCELNRIITAPAGSGIQLPPSRAGLTVILVNHGANAVQVYGSTYNLYGGLLPVGDVIDDQASATGVSQMVNSVVIYSCYTPGFWYSEGLATGFARSTGLQTLTYATIVNNATNTQASGTPITTQIVLINNSSNPGSVTLPASAPGLQITVINTVATNVTNVFPSAAGTGTENINGGAANASIALTGLQSCTLNCAVAGAWWTVPHTPS